MLSGAASTNNPFFHTPSEKKQEDADDAQIQFHPHTLTLDSLNEPNHHGSNAQGFEAFGHQYHVPGSMVESSALTSGERAPSVSCCSLILSMCSLTRYLNVSTLLT